MNQSQSVCSKFVHLYDTTLRDGAQRKGLSFSLEDKLKIASLLDNLGVSYIEGGWPGSNPKDAELFRRLCAKPLKYARLVAFGCTRKAGAKAENDANLRALLDAGTAVTAIVGKSSRLHVERVLETSLQENLDMIHDSVSFLKSHGKEVVFDAEHFFDGFLLDAEYALSVVATAAGAGADWVVLCDTNGRSLPNQVSEAVLAVSRVTNVKLGIHAHNDSELAVANSLAAVQAGASQIQGTINGYGERCGNANLVSLIPTLQLKCGYTCIAEDRLCGLTELSRTVSEIANLTPDACAPYVGTYAFAHKAGLHVAAVERVKESYEHIEPSLVGNSRQVVVSELSGRGNIRMSAAKFQVNLPGNEQAVLHEVKDMEDRGYQFENAEGTVELLIRRAAEGYVRPFELGGMMVMVSDRGGDLCSQAVVKLRVGEREFHTAADGSGPVHALDLALRKALLPSYPELARVRLADYKVRILDPDEATDATTRVFVEASSGDRRWSTVGCSRNIIEASGQALADSFELFLVREVCCEEETKREGVA